MESPAGGIASTATFAVDVLSQSRPASPLLRPLPVPALGPETAVGRGQPSPARSRRAPRPCPHPGAVATRSAAWSSTTIRAAAAGARRGPLAEVAETSRAGPHHDGRRTYVHGPPPQTLEEDAAGLARAFRPGPAAFSGCRWSRPETPGDVSSAAGGSAAGGGSAWREPTRFRPGSDRSSHRRHDPRRHSVMVAADGTPQRAGPNGRSGRR
jgi:hypothetical protein